MGPKVFRLHTNTQFLAPSAVVTKAIDRPMFAVSLGPSHFLCSQWCCGLFTMGLTLAVGCPGFCIPTTNTKLLLCCEWRPSTAFGAYRTIQDVLTDSGYVAYKARVLSYKRLGLSRELAGRRGSFESLPSLSDTVPGRIGSVVIGLELFFGECGGKSIDK